MTDDGYDYIDDGPRDLPPDAEDAFEALLSLINRGRSTSAHIAVCVSCRNTFALDDLVRRGTRLLCFVCAQYHDAGL